MSFWSGEKLEARLGGEGLVVPFNPKQIDCAAYQLRLGSDIYVSPASEVPQPNQVSIRRLKDDGEAFTVPSGQFAFLMTDEVITVPHDAIAFISIRATVKFRGLVNVSGFHVDPGYKGRLIFSVFNAGPAPVHLRQGDTLFLIWYADLDRTSERVKAYSGGHTTIPAALINPIAGGIHSFDGLMTKLKETEKKLDERLQKVERDHQYKLAIATVLVTIAVTIGGKYLWNLGDETPQRSPVAIERAAPRAIDSPAAEPAAPAPDAKGEPLKHPDPEQAAPAPDAKGEPLKQ